MIQYQKTELTMRDKSEELLSEGSGGLPFACCLNESERFVGRCVPWHWHEWVEFNYIESGICQICTPDQTLEASPGEAVFLNGNVLHSCHFPKASRYYSYTCDARFLAGEYGSYLDQRYFSPILHSASVPIVHLRPDSARRIMLISILLEMTEVLREEPLWYEFTVREMMSKFFLLLLEEVKEILPRRDPGSDRDMDRMKRMLQYVYTHFAEPIGLPEIAHAAGISPRECSRCFQREIRKSPVRFLIEYRIRMAALRLLRTRDSVSSIAEQCGFLSDSYFGKVFREINGCTPREYRKR